MEGRAVHSSDVIDKRNWQRAVVYAIRVLPDNLADGVGWEVAKPREFILVLSGDPLTEDGIEIEHPMFPLEIRWFNGQAEEAAWEKAQGPYSLRSSTSSPQFAPSDPEYQWPFIRVDDVDGLFVGRATVGDLMECVQLAVLRAVTAFCPSLGIKEVNERYVWAVDGRPVLAWQAEQGN
jgi:hypothetical protein